MAEQREWRTLFGILAAPFAVLVPLVVLALILPSDWSNRMTAVGLAFEITGVLVALTPPLIEAFGFWFIRSYIGWTIKAGLIVGGTLIFAGFILQYIGAVTN